MVTITERAREFVRSYRLKDPKLDWFLMIEWRKGSADNSRSSDGAAVWERETDPGWCVIFGGYEPGRVESNVGEEVMPGVRVVVQ